MSDIFSFFDKKKTKRRKQKGATKENTKTRRTGETQRVDGSGKLYPKETNFPNTLMSTRKYALISIRIFLVTLTTLRRIFSMGALRCLIKVYTMPRRYLAFRMDTADFRRDTVFARVHST